MIDVETWKEIKGYEGCYAVSSQGRVKSLTRVSDSGKKMPSKTLKPQLLNGGYLSVSLYSHGKRKHATIHRLVASAFLDNPKNKSCVNHVNGIKTDNRLVNLEWSNHSENLLHAYKTGLNTNHGVGSCKSKFSKKDVSDIRRLLKEGKMYQKDIAKKYGVSKSVITDLKKGRSYQL